jgi:hypothetical protein
LDFGSETMTLKQNYWEDRYRKGGDSGKGSRGWSRNWKWFYINRYVNISNSTVIDVGCGDLDFWKGRSCKHYIGIDISLTRIELNKGKRPDWNFICGDASKYLKMDPSDVVFCNDILFHIIDDETYRKILEHLTIYSKQYIFIYTWWKNPFLPKTGDGEYQKYRDFDSFRYIFDQANFELIRKIKTPRFINPYGAMWIFKKKLNSEYPVK